MGAYSVLGVPLRKTRRGMLKNFNEKEKVPASPSHKSSIDYL